MDLLTYDWKARQDLVEYVEMPTPKDSVLQELDPVIRCCNTKIQANPK